MKNEPQIFNNLDRKGTPVDPDTLAMLGDSIIDENLLREYIRSHIFLKEDKPNEAELDEVALRRYIRNSLATGRSGSR